jgi:outer membrane protein assembly factor BamD
MKRFFPHLATACLLSVLAIPSPAGILKKSQKKTPTTDSSADTNSKQPDKELYDKAMAAMKATKYDLARLDLQTLLNTYPESEYQMKAKLAVGDTWFDEGGSAALAQAEAEYKDFITFFPNQPEAAEAQMRVADIYYRQMNKPDRDYTNVDRAAQEYQTMIQQYPESPLVPRAKQRLREVQEIQADRQYTIGSFYASHENWGASIARLETVTENYPLYSHSDLALIQLGDDYSAEARYVQTQKLPDKAKQELMKAYDDRAADAYARVVTHYATAPHVEDARERLLALNRPIPSPTAAELAASETEEQSRVGITLKDRALLLVQHGPTTVHAARVGEPTMTDPKEITAPEVNKDSVAMYGAALAGKPIEASPAQASAAATEVATQSGTAAPSSGGSAPLQLQNIPSAGNGPVIGASIVSTGDDSAAADTAAAPPAQGSSNTAAADTAAAPPAQGTSNTAAGAAGDSVAAPPVDAAGAAAAAAAAGVPGAQNPGGLAPVRPDNAALPPVEKTAPLADQTNDVTSGGPAQVSTGTTTGVTGKKPSAPKYDSSTESSSKHKKKKGLKKLNPF